MQEGGEGDLGAVLEVRKSGAVSEDEFRLPELSIQRDHMHLGVVAMNLTKLSGAIQRLKQQVQAALKEFWGITGTIYAGRFHMRVAETPTEVRRSFAYIRGDGRHPES